MTLSAEQTKAAQWPQRRAAERRYGVAVVSLARHNAQFLAMKEAGASPAALLEFLGQREKARKALAEAQAGLINAGWADGTLTHADRLGEAVAGMLSAATA